MTLSLLQQILSDEQIVVNQEKHPLGNDARFTVYPRTAEEIAEVVRVADRHGLKITPSGRGTKRGFGGLAEMVDICLSLREYSGIVEHSAADLTLVVRSGTTIKEIQDYLAPYGQMLALDPFWPEQASIGGVIAANDSGPRRFRYGSARDHVLGLSVVYADGQILRSGGKTVKNVAGYDLNKLFVGSMGTLGIINTVTLKLLPRPKFNSVCLISFPNLDMAEIRRFVIQLLDSTLEPVSIELISPSLCRQLLSAESFSEEQDAYGLAIAFEDRKSAVDYQIEWVSDHLPAGAEWQILEQRDAEAWWSTFAKLPVEQWGDDFISLKIGSNHLTVLNILEYCQRLDKELQLHMLAHGGAGHGLTNVHLQGSEKSVRSFVERLRDYVAPQKGYVIVQHAPLRFRQVCSVWGELPAYFPLLEKIKKTFDPKSTLSPQRYIGGL